ncbi:DUF418 domain-containing protein [Nocardiopsis composta]|uniref:Putative membrane protein YeiB n=1 Tax=Nocardiopsis composta TaxID=157465 RepID=A0A7W8VEJ3_9ACTN|nr:DUF418 domain-containing protein [Nocardiopsis composta]MBB5433541.1 putative membrane protein YeiB [Nocardiopsis composta]
METPRTGPGPTAPGGRIEALDALRGFALCGIIFVNIPQTLEMYAFPGEMPDGLRMFVLGRFYPIFYLLFGVGFGLFLRSARRRSGRPRLLLLRRLAALGVLGALLHLLQPGEVLLPFTVAGAVVLLPLSFAPKRALLPAAVLLTAAGVLAGVGGFGLLPGLFALGYALAERGGAASLPHRRAVPTAAAAAAAAACTAALFAAAYADLPDPAQIRIGAALSLSMSACYAALFLLALGSPAGAALAAPLAPMGRMALTNYVTAALLFVPIGTALGLHASSAWGTAALLGAGILALQAVFSAVWLRRFAFGPLEWAWRCAAYGALLPIASRR